MRDRTLLDIDITSVYGPVTSGALRVATSDPLGLAEAPGCRHDGPSTTVGVCWRLDQPLADRMLQANAQIAVKTQVRDGELLVRCDSNSFQGIATRVRIGPNHQFPYVHLP